jgi:tRNA pseudouridine55 synthase
MPVECDGLLLVDKPPGKTSHDIVDAVRRRYGLPKVGHCGTLDPAATGLLMLVIGRATKIQDLLMAEDKRYTGTLLLGKTTTTQDAQGGMVTESDCTGVDEAGVRAAFEAFKGDFYQTPPMVSAVKQGGVPLYKLARRGQVVERQPRLVTVYECQIDRIQIPEVDFRLVCSKGFYVRTYCHDIGQKLGCGGLLQRLRRTQSGHFSIDQAISWERLQSLDSLDALRPHILSLPAVSRIRRQ